MSLPCHLYDRERLYIRMCNRSNITKELVGLAKVIFLPIGMISYKIIDADESGFVTLMPAAYFVKLPEVVS